MIENTHDEVAVLLRAKLEAAQANLAAKTAELLPIRDEVHRLQTTLRHYTTESMGSRGLTDEEIVNWIREHASEAKPLRVPEIAAGLGVDSRGISKRLPRMARDGLAAGDKELGYYVSGWARGKRAAPNRA